MTIVTLLYLSGAITGTVVGEVYQPLNLPINDSNVIKECTTKTTTNKEFNMEIKEYIENVYTEEVCVSLTKPEERHRPIRNALRKNQWNHSNQH